MEVVKMQQGIGVTKKGHSHPSIIAYCGKTGCDSRFQDKHYGKNVRIMNEKQGKMGGYKCTICNTNHASPRQVKIKEE